jgi:hypothetical protein
MYEYYGNVTIKWIDKVPDILNMELASFLKNFIGMPIDNLLLVTLESGVKSALHDMVMNDRLWFDYINNKWIFES